MNRPEVEVEVWTALRLAVPRREVKEALTALYAWVDEQVAAKGARCLLSGRCCNFEAYGHRLYVTALEVAWFAERLRGQRREAPDGATAGKCAYQRGKSCEVHGIRPAGCRLFFCQDDAAEWQSELYEELQRRLRRLHDEMGLPYRYLEWREALASYERWTREDSSAQAGRGAGG